MGQVRQLSHSIWHLLDPVQNTASSCAPLPGTGEMLMNWSEFKGQLPRLAGVVSFCFVRRSRGTVPVVEPGEEKAWGTFPAPV